LLFFKKIIEIVVINIMELKITIHF